MGRFFVVLLVLSVLLACESPAALGAGCERASQCASPLVCRIEHCRSECVENRDCPIGSNCLIDEDGLGACSVAADRGCGAGGTVCGDPLTCVNDQCVNTCTSASDCPDDGECRALAGLSFCFAPDRSDAGAIDAATSDAGVDDAGTDAGIDAPIDGGAIALTGASLCVGDRFACAVHTGGTVGCWGINGSGQLGDGTSATTRNVHVDGGTDFSATPVTVIDDQGDPIVATAVACTEQAACAIIADGAIVCWGGEGGAGGMLSGDRMDPMPARAHVAMVGGGFVDVRAGRYHYCASKGTSGPGSVACWGNTDQGQLGDGTSAAEAIDLDVSAWAGGVLAVGGAVTCVLRDGVVSCAGTDDAGETGPDDATFPNAELTATTIHTAMRVTQLVVGLGFECALLANHSIQCWGWDAQGSLGYAVNAGDTLDDCSVDGGPGSPDAGTPPAPPCHRTPHAVDGALSFAALWSGGSTAFVCAQTTTGATYCWGDAPTGDCGFVATGSSCKTPVAVPVFDDATEIATGTLSTCARSSEGHITCIGSNDYGALGRGSADPAGTLHFDAVGVIGF